VSGKGAGESVPLGDLRRKSRVEMEHRPLGGMERDWSGKGRWANWRKELVLSRDEIRSKSRCGGVPLQCLAKRLMWVSAMYIKAFPCWTERRGGERIGGGTSERDGRGDSGGCWRM